jgi:hypothetical protein
MREGHLDCRLRRNGREDPKRRDVPIEHSFSEWMAYDGRFRAAIGLAEHERVAGFIHIGRTTAAIEDRPRPPLAQIVTNFPE